MANGGTTMVKREITETVYEYDGESKLIKKTVTETKEEDCYGFISTTTNLNTIQTTPSKQVFSTSYNDSICTSPIINCCEKQD